jgi:hypothetical protein
VPDLACPGNPQDSCAVLRGVLLACSYILHCGRCSYFLLFLIRLPLLDLQNRCEDITAPHVPHSKTQAIPNTYDLFRSQSMLPVVVKRTLPMDITSASTWGL